MCANIRSHEIAFHHFLDKTFRGGRCDNRITLKNRANRIQQRFRFRIFQQKTGSSGSDRSHNIFIQIECRQNNHFGTGDF